MSLFPLLLPRRFGRSALAVLMLAAPLALPAGVASASSAIFSAVRSPTDGGSVAVGTPLIIAGDAVDGEVSDVESVQVSVDGGTTWFQASGTSAWSLVYTPTEAGQLTIVTRASDGLETHVSPQPPVHVTVGDAAPAPAVRCPCELRLPTVTGSPRIADPDTSSVEVGVRFQLDRAGFLTGMGIRRAPYTEPISGHIWGPDGTLLASSTFVVPTNDPTSVVFFPPVPVAAGVTYVASYFTADGHYDSAELYFGGALVQPPFTTVFDDDGGAGVYQYGNGPAFPTLTWNRSNYWITPMFTENL